MEMAEQARQEIDREEMELRTKQRFDLIQKANDTLYLQTDKMKMLKSQKMYSDAIHTRKAQIQVKSSRREVAQQEDRERFVGIIADVEAYHKEEEDKIKRQQEVDRKMAADLARQVEISRRRRQEEEEEQVRMGEELLRAAKAAVDEENRKKLAKVDAIKRKNEEVKVFNKQLSMLKVREREVETLEADRRARQVEEIESRAVARKQMEDGKFAAMQETRQRMIQQATQRLAMIQHTEDTRVENQVAEAAAKQEAAAQAKEARRAALWNDIVESRAQQMDRHRREREEEERERDMMRDAFAAVSVDVREETKERLRKQKEEKAKFRQSVTQQVVEKERKQAMERQAMMERLSAANEVEDGDWERYQEEVRRTIDDYERQGKPTYPIKKALHYKQPDLMSALPPKPQ